MKQRYEEAKKKAEGRKSKVADASPAKGPGGYGEQVDEVDEMEFEPEKPNLLEIEEENRGLLGMFSGGAPDDGASNVARIK